MELYQIRQFVAVAETGSFTKGAARVAVSQPALSAAIAKLETEMGVKLFDRRRGHVLPTPAGARFLEAARGILLACNAVKADLRAISAPRALRVGVLQTLSTRHVADLLGAFRRTRPEIVLQLVDAARDELETRLDQEKLDVILTSLDAANQRKNAVVLFKEPYVLAVSLDHRFAKLKSITLKDLNNEPFIVRTSCETFQNTTKVLLERGIRARLVYRTEHDDRALALVGAGVGVALVPALDDGPGVAKVRIPDFDATRTIGLRWQSTNRDERVDFFVAFARNHNWSHAMSLR